MKKLLFDAPQVVGVRRAWDMYHDILAGNSEYVDVIYGKGFSAPVFESLDEFQTVHRQVVAGLKREEEKSRAPKRRKASAENEGYSEPVVEPEIESSSFSLPHIHASLAEDCNLADAYASLCESESNPDPFKDDFVSVFSRAFQNFKKDQARPVLTNELSDFSNPYMMKRKTGERYLHEVCVRNKLEESLVDDFLDTDPSLSRLRSQADLPREVSEPLQAFRGLSNNWAFDPSKRMAQKLAGIAKLLDIPITVPCEPVSTSVRRGGWGHGKPKRPEPIGRYPTLASVAHSLPKDPQYAGQAMHAINVLERSKGWDYHDKTKAVNTLKEVLDNLGSSSMWAGKLNKAFQKSARRKPSNLLRRNRIRMYFKSPIAVTPLARRWTDRKAKNVARSKKEKKK